MANVIELFINTPVNAKLDLDNLFPIALQYSVADIRDISKRNAAYSKTLMLPGTKTNNYWLGNLFDINSDFTMFNPNKKTDAKILVNGEIVIDGFLQLRKINKDVNVDHEGNNIQYECVIYNNFVDLMTELGEQTLYELDLSEFNHTFELATITQSWQHTWEDGYVYPMYGVETQTFNYNIDNFWPSPFYKMVFDRILSEAGYGWTGSFRQNEQFDKEVIAYIRDGNVYIDETEKNRRQFRAGVINDTVVSTGNFINTFGGGQIGSTFPVPFNNDTITPNFDNDDHWDLVAYEWTIDRNGTYDVKFNIDARFSIINNSGYLAVNPNFGYAIQMRITSRVEKWNGTSWATLYALPVITDIAPGVIANGSSYSINIFYPNQVLEAEQLYAGEKIRITMRVDKTGISNQTPGFWLGEVSNNVYTPIVMPTQITFRGGQNYILNEAYTTEIVQGDTLELGVFLPDKIKQKDLISDLIKRYNLYIEVDPDNDRLLIINERPNYYPPVSTKDTIDWTYKKDFSAQDNIELLSELQFKEMLFTWTEDSDLYNKTYQDITGDVYGQYSYIFDNDFVKGVKEIKSPFSPTPLVKTEFGAFVPAIDPTNAKVKPRILYWGGLKDYGSSWVMNYQDLVNGGTISTTFNQYPYAGHWDDPIEPTLDIHFGTPKYIFYNDWEQTPTNTMYNTYWSQYIKEIEDGRLLTAMFYLDETDIRYIKDNFNTKIFIKDAYYYVNKIIDYKPLEYTTTKVELIKISDGIRWINAGNGISEAITATACPNDIVAKKFKNGYFYVSASGATVSQGCCESIGGIWDASTNSCRVKKRPIRPVADWDIFKKEIKGTNNSGNGVFMGNNNKMPIGRYSTYNNNWILKNGYWEDSGVWVDEDFWNDTDPGIAGNYFTTTTRGLVFGNNNEFTSDNILALGGDNNKIDTVDSGVILGSNNNITDGEANLILSGSNNQVSGFNNMLLNSYGSTVSGNGNMLINSNSSYITVSNSTLINVNNTINIQPDTIYLGPSFSVNSITGAININGSTFSITGTAGYIPKFTGTNTLGNSGWLDITDITAYQTSGGTYSAVFYYNQTLLPSGSLANPGISFVDNNENGFYYSSNNVYAVVYDKFVIMSNGATAGYFDNKGLNMDDNVIIKHRFSITSFNGTGSVASTATNYIVMTNGGTLYLPVSGDGRTLTIKNTGTQVVRVEATASQVIDNQTDLELIQWESVSLIGDGNQWYII